MTLISHLESRHFDVSRHRVWLSEEEGTIVFPLWNLSGQLKGYQQYRPNVTFKKTNDPKIARYYSYVTEPVWWGFESWTFSDGPVFLTEGIFDAARITSRGYSALAVLSNDPGRALRSFMTASGRRTVVVADNDENRSGNKLLKFGHSSVMCEPGQDLGSASDDFVSWLLVTYG